MASFDALVRFLMRGDLLNSAYNTLDWAVLSPSRSILGAIGAGAGGVGAGIGAALRAVRNWVFGSPEAEAEDEVSSAPTSPRPATSSAGLNGIYDLGLGIASSSQSLNSSYYSAQDGDSQVYLLAPSASNSQEEVAEAAGETAV